MAFFVRVGARILNVEAVLLAERKDSRLIVTLGRDGGPVNVEFEGADADKVEAEILRLQSMNDEYLRRNRIVSSQQ
jgi:hypothetical protein